MTVCRTALLAFALTCAATACADFGDYESHTLDGQTLTVETTRGTLTLDIVNATTMSAHYAEPGVTQLPSFALSGQRDATVAVLAETRDVLLFGSERLMAEISREDLTISYNLDGEPLVAEAFGYYAHDSMRGFRFALEPGEKLIGGGQRVLGMDRRGHRLPLYNRASYGYTTDADQMYYGLPAVMSSDRYAIVFDNTATGWLDLGATIPDVLDFQARAGRTGYIVSGGESFPALVTALTGATGRQPLPPRWAFGNIASRFGYHTEQEVRNTIAAFREAQVPVDAVVIDLYWFGPDIKGHMGKLDWDREAFPTPESMITDLNNDGVRTVLITEPFILTTSTRWQEALDAGVIAKNFEGGPRTFDFYFGNTGLIDVFDDKARDWFWNIYEGLYEQGVAGVWGDLGEPEVHPDDTLHTLSDSGQVATGDAVHNAYGHEWARLVYENHARRYPDERAFIMMRAGFAGTQRYGIVPWTGDVDRSWGGLKPQVELSLQMGLFGLGYIHSDLGGFAGGERFDRELYLRWLQMGVYQPVFRPHAQEHIAPEPVFHDRRTLREARRLIEQRYRLLPYIQTLAHENTTTGLPFVRPLFFADETDPRLFENTTSYLFGDALLVTPVTSRRVRNMTVDLPKGVWFSRSDGARYEGGDTVVVPTPVNETPVLVRAGAFLPLANVVQTTRDYSTAQLTLHWYADASVENSVGRLIEDDGHSRDSNTASALDVLKFAGTVHDGGRKVSVKRGGQGYEGMPDTRTITLVVHNQAAQPAHVRVDGRDVGNEQLAGSPVVSYAPKTRELRIRFEHARGAVTIEIED
ncbi:MAG: TIM-barrel domain-containing protein [Pseudomonadota bacterium]